MSVLKALSVTAGAAGLFALAGTATAQVAGDRPSAPGSPAPTQATGPIEPASEELRVRWYGSETLLADGVSAGFGLVAAATASGGRESAATEVAGAVAIGGYLLGAPIVHWGRGHIGQGFASLGLRMGAPVVLSLLGFVVGEALCSRASHDNDVPCPALAAAVGGVLGFPTAIAIDAAGLAWETAPREDGASVRMRPIAVYAHGTWLVGAAGSL